MHRERLCGVCRKNLVKGRAAGCEECLAALEKEGGGGAAKELKAILL